MRNWECEAMGHGVRHAPEVVAAVLADLLTGTAVEITAKNHGVPARTVYAWQRQPPSGRNPREEFGAQLSRYTAIALHALAVQAAVMADPDWIRGQPAHDLAIAHGVLADKTVRILHALEPAETVPQLPSANDD